MEIEVNETSRGDGARRRAPLRRRLSSTASTMQRVPSDVALLRGGSKFAVRKKQIQKERL